MQPLLDMFQKLPWWAKSAFAFLFIVVGISVADLLSKNPGLLSSLTKQSISTPLQISRTVYNRQNQPIKDVNVQVIFDGPPVQLMTDRNGYFQLEIPAGKKRLQVILTKENFEIAREEINLEADPNFNKIIYLDSIKPVKPIK